MNRKTLDLWVGLFVVAGFGAIFFLALKVGNFSFAGGAEPYRVQAHFDNIGGLKVRAPVKSSGVLVGRVVNIRFDQQQYRAEVTLEIDADYLFPADTVASILTSGLLGEQYIGLDPGGDEEMLASGDSLMLTQSAMVLENLIGQFLFRAAQSDDAAEGQ